jgi:hypothetical protein
MIRMQTQPRNLNGPTLPSTMIQAKSVHCFLVLFSLSKAFAFMGPSFTRFGNSQGFQSLRQPVFQRKYVHATDISPFNTLPQSESPGFDPDNRDRDINSKLPNEDQIDEERTDSDSLQELCQLLQATPENLLRLESTPGGARGVYLNRSIKKGDVILSLPLDSCLRDDFPPSWMQQGDGDDEGGFSSAYNPSDWATRLAAGILDLQLREMSGEDEIGDGQSLWLSMLPDPGYLRASLPVHWPEETVQNSRSTALELAVDSSYFARAEKVEDILFALKSNADLTKDLEDQQLRELCNNALDVVQTRSCRLVDNGDDTTLRVLAPIYDFINHGSINVGGEAGANSQFQLEDGNSLVVRAVRDVEADQEVLIDYGESSRPAWRCLLSYGFVPQYNRIPGPDEEAFADSDEEDNVAEVYIDGKRYEVGPSQVPFEMVVAAFESDRPVADEEGDIGVSLTPEVALKLADRISEVAFYLLLEPEGDLHDDDSVATPTPFEVISSREAASLRWSQHRVLIACSLGLREFAADQKSLSVDNNKSQEDT